MDIQKNEITPNFHLPTEIYVESNIIENIAPILSHYGSRITIVITEADLETNHKSVQTIAASLQKAQLNVLIYDELPQYPNTEDIDRSASFLKKLNSDLIVGIGSVNSINAAKALSILSTNFIFCNELFNRPFLPEKPVPLVTIPTYPAFGFEINPYLYLAEIHNLAYKVYSNNILYPVATIIDPTLSFNIDIDLLIKSTICALGMATESVISNNNNNITNTFALKAIDLIFRNILIAYNEEENISPREHLATASVMSGIAFSTSRLSVSLAMALAISAGASVTVENAMCLLAPHIMEFNLTTSPGKYVQMSKVMGEDVRNVTVIEAAIKAVEAMRKLQTEVDVPHRLSFYEVSKAEFKTMSELALTYPFYDYAPRPFNVGEIETILTAAY